MENVETLFHPKASRAICVIAFIRRNGGEFMSKNLTILATIKNWPKIYDFLYEYFFNEGLQSREIQKLIVSCEEIFTNIVCHSGIQKFGEVEISAQYDALNKSAVLTFMYGGIQFDVAKACSAKLGKCDNLDKFGGLGLLILKKFTDDIKYSYSNYAKKNTLVISKKIV